MPTKKTTPDQSKPKQSSKPENSKLEAVEDIQPDAMDAAVIAELVKAGVPFAEAKAQVLGGAAPAPVEAEPDIEPPIIPQKSKDFSDAQVKLYEMLESLDEDETYKVELELPAYLMDWLIRKTLQEAFVRNNPGFLLPDFFTLMVKEQRAIDPTKGGKVKATSSGPKDLYNPATGAWS